MDQSQKQSAGIATVPTTWRPVTLFCLILLPAAGQILSPPAGMTPLAPLNAAVFGGIFTAVLFTLVPLNGFGARVLHLLSSAMALILLPDFGLTGRLLAPETMADSGRPVLIALCWIAGVTLSILAQAMRQLLSWQAVSHSSALIHPVHLLFSFAILGTGFWLLSSLLLTGSAPPYTLASAVIAVTLALYTLATTLIFDLGITIARDRKEMAPSDLAPLFLTLVAGGLYGVIANRATGTGPPPGYMTVLFVMALISVFLLRRFSTLALAGALLMLTTPLLVRQITSDPVNDPGLMALLAALPISVMRTGRRSGGNLVRRAGDPPPGVLATFNRASTSWLILLDLNKRTVHFPHGSAFSATPGTPVSFNRIFQESGASGLLDLLRELQKPPDEPSLPIRIQLQMKPPGEARTEGRQAQLFEARILENRHPLAWLALFSLSHEKDLAQRAEKAEARLADAVIREERLLSFAAHELRTPIAILAMLAEELRNGSQWADIHESFDQTMDRITSILADLRTDNGAVSGPAAARNFTPSDLVAQLTEIFAPVATTHGIALETSCAEQADLPLKGDFGRIFIALSKLVHNGIIHSGATIIRLSVIVSRGAESGVMLTWQVSDNGIGIAGTNRERIFEPFETDATNMTGRAGLGLYTARKAIRLLGGNLTLSDSPEGCHFVLTHPVRSADLIKTPPDDQKPAGAQPSPLWFARSALLIEDNRLVCEITRTRLQRLFQRVDWAETGPAGLEMWRGGSYDLILVDQLLPGLTGCEIVRKIRKTDRKVPIIGITASTLGTECKDLEAAGVTIALEKPLSFAQIRGLAEDWFPIPAVSQARQAPE